MQNIDFNTQQVALVHLVHIIKFCQCTSACSANYNANIYALKNVDLFPYTIDQLALQNADNYVIYGGNLNLHIYVLNH